MDQNALIISYVFLNHISTIIDEKTYDEIKNSAFVKNEFCHCQEKTKASKDFSWTGFYLTGENTYIELFNRKTQKRLLDQSIIGDIGIAFSVDHQEDIEPIIKLLEQEIPNGINHGLFKSDINHTLVPWFYYVEMANSFSMKPQLDPWIMAYQKEYFRSQVPGYSDNNGSMRKFYNKNCNSVPPYDEVKLFKDIEEISLLLSSENKRKFVTLLLLLGYHCQETNDVTICRGPGIVLNLASSENQSCKFKKLQVTISLNSTINPQVHNFGNSTLELGNQTAIWTFN